jgi:hypothetical protein
MIKTRVQREEVSRHKQLHNHQIPHKKRFKYTRTHYDALEGVQKC